MSSLNTVPITLFFKHGRKIVIRHMESPLVVVPAPSPKEIRERLIALGKYFSTITLFRMVLAELKAGESFSPEATDTILSTAAYVEMQKHLCKAVTERHTGISDGIYARHADAQRYLIDARIGFYRVAGVPNLKIEIVFRPFTHAITIANDSVVDLSAICTATVKYTLDADGDIKPI